VAYDDKVGAEDRQVVGRGYAASLAEADAAAKSALAEAGLHHTRRESTGFGPSRLGKRPEARPVGSDRSRPREYLYTREVSDQDGTFVIAAHMILKKTPKKVYVTQRSCGPDQLGTEDERWEPDERAIALDRAKLERDGSVYSQRCRHSDFYISREAALGDSARDEHAAFRVLGLRAPCTIEDIKVAYRRKAFEVHPDRGGSPDDFRAVEHAYRQLLHEAQASRT
jgi:DnaJ domain